MLKKNLDNLGHSYKEVADSIFEVYDILSDEEASTIWKIIKTKTQADWESDYRESQIQLAQRKYGRTDIDNLIKEGVIEYTDNWSDKSVKITRTLCSNTNKKIVQIFSYDRSLYFGGLDHIQRQYPGSELREHVDNYADPTIRFATIVYVNDDYTNGELFFSKLNLSIKPRAKSLMIFPGDELYSHGVRPPGIGETRYVLPSFVRNYSESIP